VSGVSRYFDRIDHRFQHREFITHTGWIGDRNISVVSTGIGTDNIDIVLNELDAIVNIDFESLTPKQELQSLQIIRIGTSGSLSPGVP
jgi:uridine phosphorylase